MYTPLHTNGYILDLCKLDEAIDRPMIEAMLDEEREIDGITLAHQDDFAAHFVPSEDADRWELASLSKVSCEEQRYVTHMESATSANLVSYGMRE